MPDPRRPRSAGHYFDGRPFSLAKPGILLDMVGHDHSDLRAETRMEHGSSRVALARSLIVLAAVAAAVGSFFASLAIANQAALASGAVGPSTSWLLSSRDWLPWICIGFGLARLAEQICGVQILELSRNLLRGPSASIRLVKLGPVVN